MKGYKRMIKQCPTCVEYIQNHSRQAYFDHHQSVILNLKAKRPKWYHRTKLGRNIHNRAVPLVGELLDNSTIAIAEDMKKAGVI
jgi:hypothetical protein